MSGAGETVDQKILIVDDIPANLVALENTLGELDVTVVRAESGNAALKETLHHDFALCIVDVHMPGMDGYELAEILRQQEHTRFVPIIFLTAALSEERAIARGYSVGGVDYLIKPYNSLVLTSKVKIFLELSRQRIELQKKSEALAAALANTEAAHEKLQQAQAHLVQTSKLAAVGELAAAVAHELNNPLTGIALYISRLLKRSTAPQLMAVPAFAVFPENLLRISQSSEQCKLIIENLLSFGRQDKGDHTALDLRGVVESGLRLAGAHLRRGSINVTVDLPPEALIVIGNRLQLQQVLINLVLNAVDAMGSGGDLAIVAAQEANGAVTLRVTDTGEGIAPEDLEQIFKPFFTTKPAGKGTGIGLSLAHKIVDQHGGSIEVESVAGKGVSFCITLPQRA